MMECNTVFNNSYGIGIMLMGLGVCVYLFCKDFGYLFYGEPEKLVNALAKCLKDIKK